MKLTGAFINYRAINLVGCMLQRKVLYLFRLVGIKIENGKGGVRKWKVKKKKRKKKREENQK